MVKDIISRVFNYFKSSKPYYTLWDWVKYFGGIGWTTGTAFMIIFIPLTIANDQEKQVMQRLLAAAYGLKLDTQTANGASSANVNIMH
ncbi:hypothetical protein ABK040_002876 [Willaertia magna]